MRTKNLPWSNSSRIDRLSEKKVDEMAREVLLRYLPLQGDGKQSSPEKVVDALLCVASGRSSIERVSTDYEDLPSANTIRGVLKNSLELQNTEQQLNEALLEHLEDSYWKKPLKVAADLHEQPYYGTPESESDLRAGKHKAGTNHFHTFATLYVIRNGRRVTLALHFVRQGDSLVSVLEALKKRLDAAQLRVKLWLVDKAFAQVEALSWFNRNAPLAYVPLPVNGRKDPPSATRALAALRYSCFVPYTMSSRDHSKTLPLTVAVAHHGQERSRSGKLKAPRTLLYAVVGSSVPRCLGQLHPLGISQQYSHRFSIESSYRQLHQGRGRTSSRSPVLRLLYVGIALLLRNLSRPVPLGRLGSSGPGGPLQALLHPLLRTAPALAGALPDGAASLSHRDSPSGPFGSSFLTSAQRHPSFLRLARPPDERRERPRAARVDPKNRKTHGRCDEHGHQHKLRSTGERREWTPKQNNPRPIRRTRPQPNLIAEYWRGARTDSEKDGNRESGKGTTPDSPGSRLYFLPPVAY
jgi:hypothetical protein